MQHEQLNYFTASPVVCEIDGLSDEHAISHTTLHAAVGAAKSAILADPNGALIGALEGMISARLPKILDEKQNLTAQKEINEDVMAQKPTSKVKLVRDNQEPETSRQKVLLAAMQQDQLFASPFMPPTQENSRIERFKAVQEKQAIIAKYDLECQSKPPSLAEKILDFFIPSAYADEAPYKPSTNEVIESKKTLLFSTTSKKSANPLNLELTTDAQVEQTIKECLGKPEVYALTHKHKASFGERWANARKTVEDVDSFDVQAKLDRNFGSILPGALLGVGETVVDAAIGTASIVTKLSVNAAKFEQAYVPENPADLYSPQNEMLRAELEANKERHGKVLQHAWQNKVATTKAVATSIGDHFSSGWADFTQSNQQGDYFGAGRVFGRLGTDAAFLVGGGYGLAKTGLNLSSKAARVGLSATSKLRIQALDLAADSMVNAVKVAAPSESLLTFQYRLQQGAAALAIKEAKGCARNNSGISNSLNSKTPSLPEVIEDYLGKDFRMLKNKSGDPIFVNNNNTRRIRFDAQNPHGDIPHGHVEHYDQNLGKWLDYAEKHRVYLKDALDYLHKPKPGNR